MMSRHGLRALASVFVALVALGGCSGGKSAATSTSAAKGGAQAGPSSTAAASSSTAAPNYVGHVALDPSHGLSGTSATLRGEGLPPGASLRVMWSTVDCNWVLEGTMKEQYKGRACPERKAELGKVSVGSDGRMSAPFSVPDDFGFAHDVALVNDQGAVVNKASYNVDMQVSVSPSQGPLGTPITIVVKGMGWQSLENTRVVLYDAQYTGWISSVTTRGSAKAVIPATGNVGPHRVGIARGAFTFPYLNPKQSPRPDIPTFDAVFTVTGEGPVLPAPLSQQNPAPQPASAAAPVDGAPVLSLDTGSGPVGTDFTVKGRAFARGASVDVQWFRIVGTRVGSRGGSFDEQSLSLGTVTARDDGTFEGTFKVPGDVGGAHRIEARVNGQKVTETSFSVTPFANPLTSDTYKWNQPFDVHLTGVGWTETANIYTVVYDNTYIGYVCGFNSQGDVLLPMQATGQPGWHYLDLYPAIYKGQETSGQDNFRIPQLTYADDHPGERLPAFHFAFRIEQ